MRQTEQGRRGLRETKCFNFPLEFASAWKIRSQSVREILLNFTPRRTAIIADHQLLKTLFCSSSLTGIVEIQSNVSLPLMMSFMPEQQGKTIAMGQLSLSKCGRDLLQAIIPQLS